MTLLTKLPTWSRDVRRGGCGQRRPALEHRVGLAAARDEVVPRPDALEARRFGVARRLQPPLRRDVDRRRVEADRDHRLRARAGLQGDLDHLSRRRLELLERHVVGAERLVVLDQRVADRQHAAAAHVVAAALLAHRQVEQRRRLHLDGNHAARLRILEA